jgi:hypothetical protein
MRIRNPVHLLTSLQNHKRVPVCRNKQFEEDSAGGYKDMSSVFAEQ